MIQEHISLKSFNTFGIEVHTSKFVSIQHPYELVEIHTEMQHQPLLILGGGSNMLFTKNFEGLVLKLDIKGIHIQEFSENEVLVTAGAGVVWNDLVQYAVSQNLGGIENLTLIPGTVGAAPVQNIGAYGVEIKDVFHSCNAFHIEKGTFETFLLNDVKFDYRESIFKQEAKGKYIITEVVFKLQKPPHQLLTSYGAIQKELENAHIAAPNIADISKIVAKIRVEKLPDPSTIGNAGSFFKNPIIPNIKLSEIQKTYPEIVHFPWKNDQSKIAAGWLIEQCGWKGKQIGEVATWKHQALVITNCGNASGSEIWAYAEGIIQSVWDKFGIKLQAEVNVL